MNKAFQVILSVYSRRSLMLMIGAIILIKLALSFIFAKIVPQGISNGFPFNTITEEFYVSVVFAPIIETVVFQSLVITSVLKRWPSAYLSASLLSAAAFGLSHFYSVPYIILTFIGGLLLSFLYLVSSRKGTSPFLTVCATHAGYNLAAFLLNQIS